MGGKTPNHLQGLLSQGGALSVGPGPSPRRLSFGYNASHEVRCGAVSGEMAVLKRLQISDLGFSD